MNLKMDLTKEDLLMFFKDYQLDAMNTIWESDRGLSTREVWKSVGENRISRASIINFLEEATENRLLEKSLETGKGGHHGIYSSPKGEQGTRKYLKKVFREKLDKL
ncbi:hypothetical protein GF326_06585 [Candidatus Bathyarchaeota archaeon]|nr:hypothetical protein [Candidatus Bathyarchaeota archaeon]